MTSRTFPLSRQRRRHTPAKSPRIPASPRDPSLLPAEPDPGTGATPAAPRLPHEKDEHTESPHAPRRPIIQAEADLAQGRVDTDRRQDAARVFDKAMQTPPRPRRK